MLANYLEFETDNRFDLIIMIMCDFCALSPTDRQILLTKIYNALEDNGAFVLDVLNTNHYDSIQESQTYDHSQTGGFWSANEHIFFNATIKYPEERVIFEKHTIMEEEKTFTIHNYLQCFTLDEIQQELAQHGFKTTEIFSDISDTPYSAKSREIGLINVKKEKQ